MGRKSRLNITSYIRYRGKMYAIGLGMFAGNEQLAMEYANALAIQQALGAGPYHLAYTEIKPILQRNMVPSALFGMYRSFACELVSKSQTRKLETTDRVIDKWVKLGLDAHILDECVEAIGWITAEETPQPGGTGA